MGQQDGCHDKQDGCHDKQDGCPEKQNGCHEDKELGPNDDQFEKYTKPQLAPDSEIDTEPDQYDGTDTLRRDVDESFSDYSLTHRGIMKPRMRICFDSEQVYFFLYLMDYTQIMRV